ncbi:uncharacterized protein LOC119159946 isoform X2 [Rhipicephalus microplus]|uniref:uncharacterized protein LOC119159946 isoform X2 n=1 Tax=Rhipicephalus microplus TaxID=6941 RepID=UPI003F6BB0C9
MDRVKVTCTFLTLVILVVTNSVGCSRTLDQLIRRRSVNIRMKHSVNSGKVVKSCRYITKGRPQHVMHVRDGTICSEVPFISEGFCLHGLCVGSYREMSVQELAEDTAKAGYQKVQSVKCSEYRRNATAARFLVDCSFRCQEKGTVYIVQERKWVPCEKSLGKRGQCIDGTCWITQPLMWIPNYTEEIGAPHTVNHDATTATSTVSIEEQVRQIEVDRRRGSATPTQPHLIITHFAEKLASIFRPSFDATRYRRTSLVRVMRRRN